MNRRTARMVSTLLLAVLKRRRRRETAIHQAADKHRPAMIKALVAAFEAGHAAINRDQLRVSLTLHDELGVLKLVSDGITAFQGALQEPLQEVLLDTLIAGGIATAKTVHKLTGLRAAAKDKVAIDWSFDETNPAAVEWANEHATDLIENMSEVDRLAIKDLVEAAFEEQFDVDDLIDKITEIIGDEARAEVIARTETMRASNEGQMQAWDQAADAGLLTGEESKEWITTPDDRLCPVCEPMDGVTVKLSEEFNVDGERMDGPPAHPRCRCTLGLTAAG